MVIIGRPTQINARQIQLDSIFSVERVLASRGFRLIKEGNSLSTILPKEHWTYNELDAMFRAFDEPESRSKFLQITENPTKDETFNMGTGLCIDRNRVSATYEWYVGELMVRRFQAFSSSFGVEIADIARPTDNGNLGDFDVLSVMGDMNLLYIECKTGRCSRKSIDQTILRASALHTVASVILLEKGVSERDLIQQVNSSRHPRYETGSAMPLMKVELSGRPESSIYRWYNCFFISGGKQTQLDSRLRTVLRLLAWDRVSFQEATFVGGESSFSDNGYSFQML